jgi:hypothetical protein
MISGELTLTFDQFGDVLRGQTETHELHFKNSGSAAAEVSGIAVTGDSFALVGNTMISVPANGEIVLAVSFTPSALGPQQGTLTWNGNVVQLSGRGIGPVAEVTPTTIDLGVVPLYDGAPASASSTLTVNNVGLEADLLAFFEVQATGNTPADELCVGDCSNAGVTVGVGESSALPVQLTTTIAGMKSWDVRVLSNDPTRPMQTISVTADVVARPTCQFAVPASLSFGLMSAPETRELEVILENVGTENCEISAVTLSDPTPVQSTLFSLVYPGLGLQTIAPGEFLRVLVRAAPQGAVPATAVPVTAELRFALNHPDGFARVPIDLELGPTCLLIAPSPVNFGAVQTGCRSADRSITVTSRCIDIVVDSASVTTFSSFSVLGQLPMQLAGSTKTLTLTARFTPFAAGPSRDVIDVAWTQQGVTKHTMVPLVGEADSTGVNVERFPPSTTKIDLLLVLDDSGSMAPLITNVNAQLPRLLTSLASSNVDFQLGVIDADLNNGNAGVLRRTSTGLRWLTPSTPSLGVRFTELTTYTGMGFTTSCEYAVREALNAPQLADPALNAGFLRPDAMLSVVCVSDTIAQNTIIPEVMQAAGTGRRFTWDDVSLTAPSTTQCPGWFLIQPGQPNLRETTGGQLFDICSTNWSPFFDVVASRPSGSRTFFPLQHTPDLLGTPPLEVSVAGQNLPAATDGGQPAWNWESTPNAVVFSPLFAPLATEPVTVTYPVACMP